jgi:hypothetical protein
LGRSHSNTPPCALFSHTRRAHLAQHLSLPHSLTLTLCTRCCHSSPHLLTTTFFLTLPSTTLVLPADTTWPTASRHSCTSLVSFPCRRTLCNTHPQPSRCTQHSLLGHEVVQTDRHFLLRCSMDSASQQRPPAPSSLSQGQALPSIASLTGQLPPSEQSPVHLRHQSDAREARDSGNWSVSQSKREFFLLSPLVVRTRCPRLHLDLLTRASDSSIVSNNNNTNNNNNNNPNMSLNVHTLLNPEESPSRNSVPDTPSSSRYPSGLSQQV